MCERHNNSCQTCWQTIGENRDKFYLSPTVCQRVCRLFLCRSHTHQLEFASSSLPCEFGRLRPSKGFQTKCIYFFASYIPSRASCFVIFYPNHLTSWRRRWWEYPATANYYCFPYAASFEERDYSYSMKCK